MRWQAAVCPSVHRSNTTFLPANLIFLPTQSCHLYPKKTQVRFKLASSYSGRVLKHVYEDGQELDSPEEKYPHSFIHRKIPPSHLEMEQLCGFEDSHADQQGESHHILHWLHHLSWSVGMDVQPIPSRGLHDIMVWKCFIFTVMKWIYPLFSSPLVTGYYLHARALYTYKMKPKEEDK